MKMLVFGMLALAAAVPAAAQDQRPTPRGAEVTRAEAEARLRERFGRVDADRDGFVTQAEVQARRGGRHEDRREAVFARLDADRDGQISRAEFMAERPRVARAERRDERAGRRIARRGGIGLGGRMFAAADADRDQRVSLSEAVQARLRLFDRVDANRDGRVTPEERRAARQASRQQRG